MQEEIRGMLYCTSLLLKSEGEISTYEVLEKVEINDTYTEKVSFNIYSNEASREMNCSCYYFESK